jgi:hypothetical protein
LLPWGILPIILVCVRKSEWQEISAWLDFLYEPTSSCLGVSSTNAPGEYPHTNLDYPQYGYH